MTTERTIEPSATEEVVQTVNKILTRNLCFELPSMPEPSSALYQQIRYCIIEEVLGMINIKRLHCKKTGESWGGAKLEHEIARQLENFLTDLNWEETKPYWRVFDDICDKIIHDDCKGIDQ